MSNLDQYLNKKGIKTPKTVQLPLSSSEEEASPTHKSPKKTKLSQTNLDIFMNRMKTRREKQEREKQQEKDKFKEKGKAHQQQHSDVVFQKKADPKKQKTRGSRKPAAQKQAVPIYSKFSEKEKERQIEELLKIRREQKRKKKMLEREAKREEQKLKAEEERRKKKAGLNAFFDGVMNDNDKDKDKDKDKNEEGEKINRLDLFNSFEAEKQKSMGIQIPLKEEAPKRASTGLIYRKQIIEREKVPYSFLKLLLSYKFSPDLPLPETKRIPNIFNDQLTYKKIFHYLVTNECIADVHTRIKEVESKKQNTIIPIVINDFKEDEDGFVKLRINQFDREINNEKKMQAEKPPLDSLNQQQKRKDNAKSGQKKQKFMLKNLSLSKNRLGIITNAKSFRIDHYGIPCKSKPRIFGFLCMLIAPETKEELKGEVRAMASFTVNELQMIINVNKTNRAYFIDLEKLSTHLRQYLAVSHLYNTEVAPFVYNPPLIEKYQFQMIPESEREKLSPVIEILRQQYNDTQFQSIREMALRESGIVLLQGPPGTGKTTTLMGLLSAEYEYLKHIISGEDEMRKILICAPSNAAIDHITKRLVCQGLLSSHCKDSEKLSCQDEEQKQTLPRSHKRVIPKILRVGIVETDDPDILSVSLDDLCDKEAQRQKNKVMKENNMTTTQVRQKIMALSKEMNKLKSRTDLSQLDYEIKATSLRNQIKRHETLLYSFRKQKIQLKQTYMQIEKQLFQEAEIILTTLSSSGSEKMEKVMGCIGCLIVDEAAQATQPNLLIPFQTGVRKVLLIGDPYQLPATTLSQDSPMTLFNRSLFQRFLDGGVQPYFLNYQYRMAPSIREFASNSFYSGRLKDADCIQKRYDEINDMKDEEREDSPLAAISQFFGRNSMFLDVKFGEQESVFNSFRNVGQCLVIKELLVHFLKNTNLSIGVITPYQAQKKYVFRELKKQFQNFLPHPKNNQKNQMNEVDDKKSTKNDSEEFLHQRVMINTVDSFQGQEKDIIIVSTVRANPRKDIGFMKDERRINVALTRSRHLMIVVGHGDTIGSNQTWNNYCSWAEQKLSYYMISEEEDIPDSLSKIRAGPCQEEVIRKKYGKLTKDTRKKDRQQIGREDFGLSKPTKKVKKDLNELEKIKSQDSRTPSLGRQKSRREEPMKRKKRVEEEYEEEQFIQKKRAKQAEASNYEQMNRRMKQVEAKLKNESGWSGLFNS